MSAKWDEVKERLEEHREGFIGVEADVLEALIAAAEKADPEPPKPRSVAEEIWTAIRLHHYVRIKGGKVDRLQMALAEAVKFIDGNPGLSILIDNREECEKYILAILKGEKTSDIPSP